MSDRRPAEDEPWNDGDADDAADSSGWEDEDEPDEADDSTDTQACPCCGKPICEDAEVCPYCGSYISSEDAPRRRPKWITIGAALAIAAVAAWVFGYLIKSLF